MAAAADLIPYAQLEVAGDETFERDLRGMFRREPDTCWFRPIGISPAALHHAAVRPEAYLFDDGGAEHFREAIRMRDAYRAGCHLPPVIVYQPEPSCGRADPEVLDGYHRLSAAVAAGLTTVDALLLVGSDGVPLHPVTG